MKKEHFITIDTETTQDSLVADFAAVITDRKGRIATQCAVLVDGIFTDPDNHPLFYTSDNSGIWSKAGQKKRYDVYNRMVRNGSRMVASPAAINRWLDRAVTTYNPILTAYNLEFDRNKCRNTGIDLAQFERSFCLWAAAYTKFVGTRAFKRFVLENHAFNPPTDKGNMTFKTNAEIMARFVMGDPALPNEPHTALEDVIYYELPILNRLLRSRGVSIKWLLSGLQSYDWKMTQVRDHYKEA